QTKHNWRSSAQPNKLHRSPGTQAKSRGISSAETIMEFLLNHGIKKERIEFEFKGEKKPIKSNKTGEGKKKNRRVDFEFF
ncbi:MAG: hypothetical protein EBU61_05525, partial [Crocinitomicaceae bacterium]|nr:hypothetical protein [Crocinitomicaceae bacterium]